MFKKASGYISHRDPELIAGLDLGTSKITVVVAERAGDGAQIIGVGQAPSSGIRKGQIVNLEQAVRSVRQAVEDAQNMVGQDIRDVTVAFGGGDMTSIRSTGMVSLGRSPRPVIRDDLERVIEAAQADVAVPANQGILHSIPLEYSLDGQDGIEDPMGMSGLRLGIDLQSVVVPMATIQNVLNSVEKAGLAVSGFVVKPLATALGSMVEEEAMAGTAVVDIGGGTTGVAIFAEGRPRHLALIPIGGDHITNDVGSVLKLPLSKADEIKKGISILRNSEEENAKIDFTYNNRAYSVSKLDLHEIIKCRIEELFDVLVKPELRAGGVSLLPGGIVLTGGVSSTEGIDAFLLDLMDLSVRISGPVDAVRMPPNRNTQEYSAASGIIRYAIEKERNPFRYIENILPSTIGGSDGLTQSQHFAEQGERTGRQGSSALKSITDVFKDLF